MFIYDERIEEDAITIRKCLGSDIVPYTEAGFFTLFSENHNMLKHSACGWNDSELWSKDAHITLADDTSNLRIGTSSMKFDTTDNDTLNEGVKQRITLGKGIYTFSAYVKLSNAEYTDSPGIYLCVKYGGYIIAQTSRYKMCNNEWARLYVTISNTAECVLDFSILASGRVSAYINAPQLTTGSIVKPYNYAVCECQTEFPGNQMLNNWSDTGRIIHNDYNSITFGHCKFKPLFCARTTNFTVFYGIHGNFFCRLH